MVSSADGDGDCSSNLSSHQEGYPAAGTIKASQPGSSSLGIVAPECARWQEKGFSSALISTLLQSRSPSTIATCARIWGKCVNFAEQDQLDPFSPEVPKILEFLQSALGLGMAYNSLWVQVSALSA